MAEEIERKFVVTGSGWRRATRASLMRQGYLHAGTRQAVRVRAAGSEAWITIKAELEGIRRLEFEYPIPLADANRMLDDLCELPLIEKTRHYLESGAHTWEIDEFHGANAGLVVAEVELGDPYEPVDLPDWLGDEVSTDVRFYNAALTADPFGTWPDDERERYRYRGA